MLDERSFCNRERLGSAVEIHGSNTNAAANEDRARRLAPDWACADSRAGPACQGLPYQGSWHREAMTERLDDLEQEKLQVVRLRDAPEDGVVGGLLADFDLPQLAVGVFCRRLEHLDEQLLGGKV